MTKRGGLLRGGGDCGGLNPMICVVASRAASADGWDATLVRLADLPRR